MFEYIDVSVFRESMTKYPNGMSIFEALSTVITSFNHYVEEVNKDVAAGILEIESARTDLSTELNALFTGLSATYNEDFTALQAQVNLSLADKAKQTDLIALSAQLNEKANKSQEAWITPTLLNGWVHFDNVRKLKYYKDNLGRVHIKGMVKEGVAGVAIFELPAQYRPGELTGDIIYFRDGFSGTGLRINSSGIVSADTTGIRSFDGVSFRGER